MGNCLFLPSMFVQSTSHQQTGFVQHIKVKISKKEVENKKLCPFVMMPSETEYRTAVNFKGENFRGSAGSENFTEKTFTDCLKPNISECGTPQNFVEKTFTDGSRTSKFVKVFSLESFPLYSIFQALVETVPKDWTCIIHLNDMA